MSFPESHNHFQCYSKMVYSLYVFALILSHFMSTVNCLKHNPALDQQWGDIGMSLERYLWPLRDSVINIIESVSKDSQLNVSSSCVQSLQAIGEGLSERREWAYQFMDSSAKVTSGTLTGVLGDYGNYDQCLGITVDEKGVKFKGKHCLIKINYPLTPRDERVDTIDLSNTPMNGTWFEFFASRHMLYTFQSTTSSLCIPSSCSSDEIEAVVNKHVEPGLLSFYSTCDTIDDYSHGFETYPRYKQFSMLSIAVLFAFVATCTIASIVLPGNKSTIINCFCAIENTKKLFAESKDDSSRSLSFIHGIRLLYLILCVYSHSAIISGMYAPITHSYLNGMKPSSNWLLNELGSNIGVGISTNFILGGFLAFYSWYPQLINKDRNVSLTSFIFLRWFRTTPVVLGCILMVLAVPMSLGSGPLWRFGFNRITQNCVTSWWHELAYIVNSADPRNICIPHGWSMSADFQLYLTSFLVMVMLAKRPKFGLFLTLLAIILGIALQGFMIYVNELPAFMSASTLDYERFVSVDSQLHLMTYNHVTAYYIGILLAYLIVNGYIITDNRKLYAGHILFPSISSLVFYIPYHWKQVGFSRTQEIMFGSIQKTLFCAGSGWLIYCASIGRAGILEKVLRAKCWVAFGRCSFTIFMVHFYFILYDVFTSRTIIELRSFPLFMKIIYTVVCSTFLGYLLHLLFEAPFINLGKAIFTAKSLANVADNLKYKKME